MHSVRQASGKQMPVSAVCRKWNHPFLPPKSPLPNATAVRSAAHLKHELTPNAAADRVCCWGHGIAFVESQAVFPNILKQYWKKKGGISEIEESRRATPRACHHRHHHQSTFYRVCDLKRGCARSSHNLNTEANHRTTSPLPSFK